MLNEPIKYKITVPGSLMVMGEHAVLRDYPSLVMAIDKNLIVNAEFIPNSDVAPEITINSNLGHLNIKFNALESYTAPEFKFVIAAIKRYQEYFIKNNINLNLNITSEFSDKIGFGSSAAVTVGTISAILSQVNNVSSLDLEELFNESIDVIRQFQTKASGSDIAASIYGGLVYFKNAGAIIEKIKNLDILNLLFYYAEYSGKKTPTKDVIEYVDQKYKITPELFDSIFALQSNCVNLGKDAILNKNLANFAQILNLHQGLQDSLLTSTLSLANIIYKWRENPDVLASKISGSGLGDCALIVSKNPLADENLIPIKINPQGLQIEKSS